MAKKFRRRKKSYPVYSPKRTQSLSRRERVAYTRLAAAVVVIAGFAALIYLKGIDFIVFYGSLWQRQNPTPLAVPTSETIPVPQLDPLPLIISEDDPLKLSGSIITGNEVLVKINDEEVKRVKTDALGKFEVSLEDNLNEGDNQIRVAAVNGDGEISAPSRPQSVILDTQPPELEVDQPEENSLIEDKSSVAVVGKTESPKITVSVNGARTIVDLEGKFSHTLQLNEGENKIKVLAVDEVGHETQVERTVTYKEVDDAGSDENSTRD